MPAGWPQVSATARAYAGLGLAALCLLGTVPSQWVATAHAEPDAMHAETGHDADIPLPVRTPQNHDKSAQTGTTVPNPQTQHTNPAAPPDDGTDQAHQDAPAQDVPLPPRLANPWAERVHTVLEKHCARCHQSGALQGRLSPEGGIANILALDAIARNPALVRPGQPDSSPLYQQMIARQMPSDVLRDGAPGEAPDAIEIHTIRVWINSLNGTVDACPERTPLTREAMATSMSEWLDAIGPERTSDTRFISLAHVYAACASDAELAAYRQGVIAVLNSLTWSSKPVAVETVGETLTMLAVRLSDLGWSREHWEDLTRHIPPAARLEMPATTRQQTHSTVPLVAGDWLAHEAVQPERYNRLLGLPPTLDDLARILGTELGNGREGRTVRRGVERDSKVASGPRIIERYTTTRGALWLAHDYAPTGDATLLDFPLLPWVPANSHDESDRLPKPLGSRALFALPNGMPAFMMFDTDGKARLSLAYPATDGSDKETEQESGKQGEPKPGTTYPEPPTHPHKTASPDATDNGATTAMRHTGVRQVRSGLSCATCHAIGPLSFEDQLAQHLASASYRGNPLERDIARRTVVGKPELESAIANDRYAVRRALSAVGVDSATQIDGHDVMTGLAARYARDLDLAAAAAELLIPAARLQASLAELSRSTTPTATLATRLMLGRLTREEFERLRPALPDHSSGHQEAAGSRAAPISPSSASSSVPSGATASALPPPAPGTLLLWPDRTSYNRDDRIVLSVSAGRPCYLTLVNIDQAGHATVLFPNEFSRDNLLKAHEVKRLPAPDALYYFRLQQPGTERFVAICEDGEPVPAGIRPDFTRMNFTELGDWEAFLDASVKAASEPRVPLNNGEDRDRKRSRKQPPRPAPSTAPAQSRAAVTVTITP